MEVLLQKLESGIEIIKEKRPEYLEAENHLILVCPKSISDKMIW